MSAGAIIAIVVIAVVLIAILALVLPRRRAAARERQVASRRREVAGEHRDAASERLARAELAEREADRERAEAGLHEARAKLHDEGLADDELDRDGRSTAAAGGPSTIDRGSPDDTRFTRDGDADRAAEADAARRSERS